LVECWDSEDPSYGDLAKAVERLQSLGKVVAECAKRITMVETITDVQNRFAEVSEFNDRKLISQIRIDFCSVKTTFTVC
jgi:hypothetical protein